MIVALLFWLLVVVCCGIGTYYGGRTGRWLTFSYVLNLLGTLAALRLQPDWRHTHLPTFTVDALLMVALVWIAWNSRRWFVIWFAGLHLVALSSHVASLFVPTFLYKTYFLLQAFWAIPMLLSFAIGAMMDHRAKVNDSGGFETRPT